MALSLRPVVAAVLSLAISLLVVAAAIRHVRKSAATRALMLEQEYMLVEPAPPRLAAFPRREALVEELPVPYGSLAEQDGPFVLESNPWGGDLALRPFGDRAFRAPALSFTEDPTGSPTSAPAPAPSGSTAFPVEETTLEQYTPDQANWDSMNQRVFAVGNTGMDPNGVFWLKESSWAAAAWDGKTIYNPSQMDKAQFASAICPGVDQIRGIREVFYAHNPFADVLNPTKAEVDEWHRIAINHVRALVGYNTEDRKVKKDHCMFARALWGQQRRFTTQWDAKYPGTAGSAYGPCQGSNNAHCGATFLPDASDQAPFLPDGHPPCTTVQGSEGVFSGPKTDIPWAIKWSRGLCITLRNEGFWGGHVGPFFHREKFGFSFMDRGSPAVMRAKWTGALMPNLYCQPGTAGCDPYNTGP